MGLDDGRFVAQPGNGRIGRRKQVVVNRQLLAAVGQCGKPGSKSFDGLSGMWQPAQLVVACGG